MIDTVADLLNEIIKKEKEKIKEFEIITHGPTIGDMYEGLTKNVLEKAMFKNLDIRVVSGFIVNGDEQLSNETDCMIVEGEGKNIPNTDKYVYEYSKVIAVIEIKKTLYSEEILDAYQKMLKVYEISEKELFSMEAFRTSYRSIVSKELPSYEEAETSEDNERMIYHSLLVQHLIPLRIILGFDGYKNEFTLRKGFLDYLSKNLGKKGYSPVSFPDLIVCGSNSLLKLNGLPYAEPINEKNEWLIYGSSPNNPIKIILEYIWTRMTYKYSLSSDIFGEDLVGEIIHPLLKTKIAMKKGTPIGWNFTSIDLTLSQLNKAPKNVEWSPIELTDDEAILMNILCENNPLPLNTQYLKTLPIKLKNEIIKGLKNKKLINTNSKTIYLLTNKCKVVTLKGKWFAAEDNSGRFMRWIQKEMSK